MGAGLVWRWLVMLSAARKQAGCMGGRGKGTGNKKRLGGGNGGVRERNGVPWLAGRVGNGKWRQPGWDAERRWCFSGGKRCGKRSPGPPE